MDVLWQDIRYGVRSLRRSPALAAAAILSLALGVGANTTTFTLINTLLLNPLPVARPSELVAVFTLDANNPTRFGSLLPLSHPNLTDLRGQNDVLIDLAGYSSPLPLSLSTGGAPERVFAQLVTGSYFDVLGVRPAAGRFFSADEDRTPGTHAVVVIGHGFWQRRLGADPSAVGRTITLNRIPFTIVGVAPDGFRGVTTIFGPDLWLPSMMAPRVLPAQFGDWLHERGAVAFNSAGRLKPGVTREQAEARLKSIAAVLEHEYPAANKGRSVSVTTLTEAAIFPGMRSALMLGGAVLMGVVGLVLLIACSNVANLLLARATARRQEIAVRLALGAGRGRVVRQLLTESIVLALIGGTVGLAFGYWGRDLLWSFRPAAVANNFVELRFDGRVFAFTFMLALISGIVFGLVPAVRASRPDLVGVLKEEARTASGHRRAARLRGALVIGQVALSLVSLVIAGLFLRNIERAFKVDLGYDYSRIAVVSVNPAQAGYEGPRAEQFYRNARADVLQVPGVSSASWSTNQPLWASNYRRIAIEGRDPRDGVEGILLLVNTVDAEFFKTLGVAVTSGREFDGTDRPDSARVAVVNETMAAKYWPNESALGKRVRFANDQTPREIVGVVKTIKHQSLGEPPQPVIYLPLEQNSAGAMVLYIRALRDPSPILRSVQRELRSMDAEVPLENPATVAEVIDQSLWMMKLATGLIAVFGALALGLACVGLYGILAYAVGQRRREIGLRMALGADRASVLRLVFREAATVIGVGVVLGLALSAAAGRAVASLLFGLSPIDVPAFAGAAAILIAVALVSGYLPARSASRLDPAAALRL
ncbi:MAG TPA: ABC transporter permease [Vicinamibacterales bacterium]|nr:ABC transporter permease [Vicinamibacterales bacterium]